MRHSMEVEEEPKLMRSSNASTRNHRPRLLYSCGVSLLTMARKAYQKVEEFNGPIGSLAQAMASLASPIVHPMQNQWLSILSFTDDQILMVENAAVTIFPQSSLVFNKIDELALFVDGVPKLFDDAIDHLPTIVHRLPLLNWTSAKLSVGLEVLIRTFTNWNSSQNGDINIDLSCDEFTDIVALEEEEMRDLIEVDEEDIGEFDLTEKLYVMDEEKSDLIEGDKEAISELELIEKLYVMDDARRAQTACEDIREVEDTCKGILGALENMEIVEEIGTKEEEGLRERKAGYTDKAMVQPQGHENEVVMKDQILDLFDEGWHMKPVRGRKGH